MKKYEFLTFDHIVIGGATLHRIRALRTITQGGKVIAEKGSLGGYLQSEDNLSHDGECWVGGAAKVYGKARVYDDACVMDNAELCQRAQAFGNCLVSGESRMRANSKASVHAVVFNMVLDGITHMKST
jgi:hypothetical protein